METKLEKLSLETAASTKLVNSKQQLALPLPLPSPLAPPLEILSFCVALPPSAFRSWDDPETNDSSSSSTHAMLAAQLLNQQSIVGTIVILKKAVMIWFGWGQLMKRQQQEDIANNDSFAVTTSTAATKSSITVGSGTYAFIFVIILRHGNNCHTTFFLSLVTFYFVVDDVVGTTQPRIVPWVH
jgi:hypothetical protein